jgi:hypothetical protein
MVIQILFGLNQNYSVKYLINILIRLIFNSLLPILIHRLLQVIVIQLLKRKMGIGFVRPN